MPVEAKHVDLAAVVGPIPPDAGETAEAVLAAGVNQLGKRRVWVVGDVPVKVTLVHAIDRDQQHALVVIALVVVVALVVAILVAIASQGVSNSRGVFVRCGSAAGGA